jgi:hypothetical protein
MLPQTFYSTYSIYSLYSIYSIYSLYNFFMNLKLLSKKVIPLHRLFYQLNIYHLQ